MQTLSEEFNSQNLSAILVLVNVVLLIAAKYYFTFKINEFDKYEDINRITPSDYTLLLKLPQELFNVREPLEQFVNRLINNPEQVLDNEVVKIVKVNPVYNICKSIPIVKGLKQLKQTIKKKEIQKKSVAKETEEYAELYAKYDQMKTEYKENPYTNFTGWVFVTFDTENDVKTVLGRYKTSVMRFRFYNKYRMHIAPEPNDIIWEHFGIPLWRKVLLRITTIIVALLIIGISFVIIHALKMAQTKLQPDRTTSNSGETGENSLAASMARVLSLKTLYSAIITLTIIVINWALNQIMVFFTKFEYLKTQSQQYGRIALKITIAKFVNTALIILIAGRIAQMSQDQDDDGVSWNMFNQSGVIGNIFLTMVISLASETLSMLFDSTFIVKLISRKWIAYRPNKFLQIEANKAFEGCEFNLSEMYFLVFKVVSVAFFYQFFLPYGLLLAALELVLIHIIAKYVLINRCCQPINLDFSFTWRMIKIFELIILIMSLGYITFDRIVRMESTKISVFAEVALGLAAFETLVGVKALTRLFMKSFTVSNTKPYSKVFTGFSADYDRLNPMTNQEAIRKFTREKNMANGGSQEQQLVDSKEPNAIATDAFNGIAEYALNSNCRNIKNNYHVTKSQNQLDGGFRDVYGLFPNHLQQINEHNTIKLNEPFFKISQIHYNKKFDFAMSPKHEDNPYINFDNQNDPLKNSFYTGARFGAFKDIESGPLNHFDTNQIPDNNYNDQANFNQLKINSDAGQFYYPKNIVIDENDAQKNPVNFSMPENNPSNFLRMSNDVPIQIVGEFQNSVRPNVPSGTRNGQKNVRTDEIGFGDRMAPNSNQQKCGPGS